MEQNHYLWEIIEAIIELGDTHTERTTNNEKC